MRGHKAERTIVDDPDKPERCQYRYAHDMATDLPAGKQCEQNATHQIDWEDGRHSFGCADHLEIEDTATVKPIAIVPLQGCR